MAGHKPATKALEVLEQAKVEFAQHSFPSGQDHFGDNAAAHLTHLEPDQIMKTLVVASGKDLAIAVLPVSYHLSLKKVAKAWGVKSAEVEALKRMPNTKITDALNELSEDNRMVVYYADVEGLAYKEIAEIMGTPIGTVMSRLHRGRKQLREALKEVAKEQGISTGKAKK